MTGPTRVLIADDHPATRDDVRTALEQAPGFTVCAEVADAAAAIEAAVREHPDLCLLDIRMPGSGIAAAWEITARLPETKVVMLTVSEDDQDLFDSLRAGAWGYLLKDHRLSELATVLRSVTAGEAAISPRMVTRIVEEFRDRSAKRRPLAFSRVDQQLTSREWEVLDLLRRGLGTGEIAERLVVSRATVRSHIGSTLKKLRVPDRESAIRMFTNG